MNNLFVVVNEKGTFYYKDEQMKVLHNENGPAIEFVNGDKTWSINGQTHRENGPAIEKIDGTKIWYKNNIIHNENGPAIELSCGYKGWFQNGLLHNENGPAVISGIVRDSYWLNGQRVTKKKWKQLVNK